MEKLHDTCPTKRFIKDLLEETDLPRDIEFCVKKLNGVLVVRLNENYERLQNY